MKKNFKIILVLFLVCLSLVNLMGCRDSGSPESENEAASLTEKSTGIKDYASELELDLNSDTLKEEVTVKNYVDGDTVHFNVPESLDKTGVLKVRFLAVDTPESTGKIEEYGKAASNYTREKLSSASSIIIESDNNKWNKDSTGDRYLVWVWYRQDENSPYRNLNLELLQNGLASASSTASNRYGEICMSALNQARDAKLNLFSGEPDPDFFYGDAIELTLKELRCNIEDYAGAKVAFTGIVTKHSGNGVYIEAYDEESDMYNGIYVYYGFKLSGAGLDILSNGNEVRIVGTVSYYEGNGNYQISGISYRAAKPDDPENIQKISEGHEPAYLLTSADTLYNSDVSVETDGSTVDFDYAALAADTTIEMQNLHVKSIKTTTNKESSSYGVMTLLCECDGIPVTVRTEVLRDENNQLIGQETYSGKTINVKGIVDCFHGDYQIKVFSMEDITIS